MVWKIAKNNKKGGFIMGKNPSLVYQVKENLKSKQAFGVKKKEQRERLGLYEKAKELKISVAQLPVDGIYSKDTFETYLKQDCYFVKWVKQEHPEVKTIDDCKQYAKDYLQHCWEKGNSAWTLTTIAPAIAKLYNCRSKDLGFVAPIRHNDDRTRSNTKTKYDAKIEARHADTVEFLRNTGLRRCEAEKLKLEHISPDFAHITIINNMGKGGRNRIIEVLDPEVVRNYIENHKYEGDRICGNLDKRLDIHSYRHDYANSIYNKKLSEKYNRGEKTEKWYHRRDGSGRKYDKNVAGVVSQNLGHNRIDTTIINYLK